MKYLVKQIAWYWNIIEVEEEKDYNIWDQYKVWVYTYEVIERDRA